MATGTIPAPTRDAIAQVVQAYGTSNPETQRDIQHLLSAGMGIGGWIFGPAAGARNHALYEQDFYDWTQQTAALIRARQWYDLDPVALAEEVESLGISQKHALGSHLKNLVMHLLKWHYQPQMRESGQSWQSSILNARDEIASILEDVPSLQQAVATLLTKRYPTARRLAQVETGLSLSTFPTTCPWTPAQVLHPDFWPGEDGDTAVLP